MKKNFGFVIVLILLLTGTINLFAEDLFFREINKNGSKKVAVFSGDSEWKKELVGRIVTGLDLDFYVNVDTYKNIKNVNESEWDVIIIIDTIKAGNPSRNVRKFLKNSKNKGKIVVITTSGGNYPLEKYGVDTVSSASIDTKKPSGRGVSPTDTRKLATEIISKIKKITEN